MRKISIYDPLFCVSRRFLFTFLIFSIIFVSRYPAQSLTTATVSVSPSTVTASVGKNFSINVDISNVLNLYGWEFRLSWNATLLDPVNATEGPFLKAGGDTFFYYRPNATTGQMTVGCTLLGLRPGVSGNGILATVTFYTKNVGECPLDLYNATLLDPGEHLIPYQTVGGYGYFTPPHDIAIINVSASPSTVLPGNTVNINVTVQNQGGFNEVFNVTSYANTYVIGTQTVSLDKGSSMTIPFTWDTAGFGKGDYIILASASIVSEEIDTRDNTLADSIVTVLTLGHDVAVKNVTSSKTVIGQGYSLLIYITGKNYGIFAETFDITAYYNETTLITTQSVTLPSGDSATLTFTWNTTDVAKGNYTVTAEATPVPGETDTVDNTLPDGWVFVTIPGDVNGDKYVNIKDAVLLGVAFGSKQGEPTYNPNADINNDGYINIRDAVIQGVNFGKSWA